MCSLQYDGKTKAQYATITTRLIPTAISREINATRLKKVEFPYFSSSVSSSVVVSPASVPFPGVGISLASFDSSSSYFLLASSFSFSFLSFSLIARYIFFSFSYYPDLNCNIIDTNVMHYPHQLK